MKIGFVGTGHIAAPMVRFLVAKGHRIVVSDRNAGVAAALAASHGVAVADNQAVLDGAEVVFLCLRPAVAAEVVGGLAFRADHRVVSVMAGITLERLRALCAPATDICMTIPLGYLEAGGCPLAACPTAGLLSDLFAPENPVIEVPAEPAFISHFAICAMVPGILDLLATGAEWLAAETGDAEGAELYTAQLMAGFLSAMEKGAGSLARERDALATEGTISLQMTSFLRRGGVHETLREALGAIGARLRA